MMIGEVLREEWGKGMFILLFLFFFKEFLIIVKFGVSKWRCGVVGVWR